VLIVEGSDLLRERLVAWVDSLPHATIAGQTGDRLQALELFHRHAPDIVLLDVELPEAAGLDLLTRFKKHQPQCRIIALTSCSFPELQRRCAQLGADQLHEKSTHFQPLSRLFSPNPPAEPPLETSVSKTPFPTRKPHHPTSAPCGSDLCHHEAAFRQKLIESDLLYQSLVQNLPQHVFRKDLHGRFTFANQPFCRSLGRDVSEILGRTDHDFFPAALAEKYRRDDLGVLTSGRQYMGEEENPQADGSLRHVSVIKTPLRDAQGAIVGLQGISWDITEMKYAQSRLQRAQRIETLGSLASGIAHDLNNILTPILMCAPLLRSETSPENRQLLTETIESAAQRATDMVRQLLSLARGREGSNLPVQFSRLIDDLARMARETFPRNLHIQTTCDPDLWPVTGDPTRLHQVLLNLCVNARDAMPNGGFLTLSADNLTVPDHPIPHTPPLAPGPYVHLQVADTGTGIPKAAQPHVFEWFFTTKIGTQGTGIGLATVLEIVKQHGGVITFSTTENQGTRFEIYLPATLHPSPLTSPTSPPPAPHPCPLDPTG
jgi:PAS domain S-box-containing protein